MYDISTNAEKPCSAMGGLVNLLLLIIGGRFTEDKLGNSLSVILSTKIVIFILFTT